MIDNEVIVAVHGRLLRQARGLVGEHDAEDLVQDAYVKFLQAGARYQGEARLQAYLSMAMRSLHVDRWRHDERER